MNPPKFPRLICLTGDQLAIIVPDDGKDRVALTLEELIAFADEWDSHGFYG